MWENEVRLRVVCERMLLCVDVVSRVRDRQREWGEEEGRVDAFVWECCVLGVCERVLFWECERECICVGML